MPKLAHWILISVLCLGAARAATFYVSPTGNNSGTGLTEATALATPQAAINKAVSGDTILLRGGNYPVGVGGMTFDAAKHRGSDTSWLTIKAYPGETPVFKWTRATALFCAIWLTDATYVEISGLTLIGWNDEITFAEADADTTSSLLYNAVGIQADGRDKKNSSGVYTLQRDANTRPHHFRIYGNTIRGFSGGGISFIQSDYLDIQGNTIEDCSWYSIWAGSGISIWQSWNWDSATDDYRIRVIGNRLFGNKALVMWKAKGFLSDGNGIIIDDFRNTQNSVTYRGVYTGRTLVANNLAVNNGGSGIHTYLCDNVDVVQNTAYHNGQVLDYGEIFALDSGNIRIVNNICVARTDRAINKLSAACTNIDYRNNLYFGGYTNGAYYSANNTFADPAFLNPAIDSATADFHLGAASPAIDSSITDLAGVTYTWVAQLTKDITGGTRSRATGPDLGAYEREGVPLPTTGLVLTGLGEPIIAGDTATSVGNDTAWASTEINLTASTAPVHSLRLVNRDTFARTVSTLTLTGSSAFSLVTPPTLPLVLNPGASTTIKVRFNPATTGAHTATVSLAHNSPATSSPFTFALSGTGVQVPYASLSSSSLSATLATSTTTTHSGLILTNNGSAPLTWNAELPRRYNVDDSQSPTGPVYSWIDIATTGTAITFPDRDDSYSTALNLGFATAFPFFGTGYTQLCVNTNGHVALGSAQSGANGWNYEVNELAKMLDNRRSLAPYSISVLLSDLYVLSGTSQVRYQKIDADTFVVSWLNVTYFASQGKRLSFQLILKRDGTIITQYQGVSSPQTAYLVGLVNTMPTTGTNSTDQYLQYVYTQNILNPSLAVRFTPPTRALNTSLNFAPGKPNAWADFSGVTSGTLAAGATQTIPVVFKSNGLVSGLTYRSTLTLTTNDPDRGTTYLPIALTVGGTTNLSPTITLTTPNRPLTLQGLGTPLTLAATAIDSGGSVAQVQFFDGTTLLGTDTTSPYTYNWSPTTAGEHQLSARVTDNSGTTATSQSVIVTVVNLPPTVAVTAPAEGAVLTTSVATPLTGTAADADGSIAKVEFYAGGILRGTTTTAPYAATWTPTTYGPSIVYAKAYDNAGGVTSSDPVNVTLLRPAVASDSLLAYWRFNEGTGLTAADLSGNARTATLGNATWTTSGKFGSAITTDQTANSKVTFDHPALGAFTFSGWVNGAAIAGVQFPVIFSLPGKGTNGANGYTLQFRRINATTDTLLRCISFNDGTGGDWQSWETIANDTWHHIVVTFDGAASSTNGLKIYVNGIARTNITNYGTFNGQVPGTIATTTTLKGRLGNRTDLTRPLAGGFDHVRLYNRVLTPAEVTALYLDEGGPTAPATITPTPNAAGIQLSWTAAPMTYPAATYSVARGITATGPFSPLATGLTSPTYADTSTAAGTTYYYTITATLAGDTGPTAGPVAATAWTALQAWRNARFGTISATGNAADLADPDGDGIPNLLEYGLGGTPFAPDLGILPTAAVTANKLTLSFVRVRADVTYTVEASNDLTSWPDTVAFTLPAVGQTATATDTVNLSTQPRRFLRLRVSSP